jgi:ABC-type uncharacterized transport system involved in gliding motility auxiliary subunit
MKRWEFFQIANRLKLANHWVQVILILSLILGLNHLALKHFYRVDLTHNHRFALSPETKAYLREMQTPVHIVSTIPEDSPRQEEQVLYRYVDQLLQEYAYESRRKGDFLLTVETVDIYKDLARAESLARENGLDQVNSLLVISDNRKRLIRANELITFANRKPTAFTGESALSSAIIEVTQEQSPKIYFTQGHQEVPPDNPAPQSGLSQITRELQLRNFTVEVVDLTTVDTVPEDASVLVIAAPKGPLLSSEVDKIRSYLFDRAGRVLVWLGPGVDAGLDNLLREWGIYLPDDIVIEPDPAYREASGTLLIRNIGEHQITQSLIENQTFIVSGLSRSVIPRPPVPADERLHFVPLFATSPSSWAESNWRSPGEAAFDPTLDLKGPVPVAIAAERRASSQLGIRVPGGRLILFGSEDLFSNRRVSSLGNVSLFFNSLNWMLDRDRMLVIPPRPVDTYKLSLSQGQMRQIGLLFLIVPGSLAICGFLISWIRQS